MRKALSLALCAVMLLCGCCAGAEEEAAALRCGDYEYALREDGTAEITAYRGEGGEAAVPAELEGRPVSAVGRFAFFGRDGLTAVKVPGSVKEIGWGAFANCQDLAAVELEDGVAAIGKQAFHACPRLTAVTIRAA